MKLLATAIVSLVMNSSHAARVVSTYEGHYWGTTAAAQCAKGPRGNFGCDYRVCTWLPSYEGAGVSLRLGWVRLLGHDAVMRDGRVLVGPKMRILGAC